MDYLLDDRISRLNGIAKEGNIDAFYKFIRNDVKLLEEMDELPFVDTPLHIAASLGHIPFAMEMMRLKPSFARKPNPDGYSPIHLALQNSETQMACRLLRDDGDLVRVKGREGMTPLHCAVAYDYLDLLPEFLSVCPHSIGDVTIQNETALHIALKYDKLEAFKLMVKWLEEKLLQSNVTISWKDDEGNTVLHVAVSKNQPEARSFFLLL